MVLKVLLTGTAIAALALAQDPGGMGGGGMGGGNSGGRGQQDMGADRGGMGVGMRAPKETKADQIVNRLKLSKDQTSEFETILQAAFKDAAPVVQQVLQSRNALATALITGKTGAELGPLQQAMAEAQFSMTGMEVRTFQRIVGLLKPNQTAKAPEAFDLMADIFIPPAASAGRGGGMGRRGGGGGGGGR